MILNMNLSRIILHKLEPVFAQKHKILRQFSSVLTTNNEFLQNTTSKPSSQQQLRSVTSARAKGIETESFIVRFLNRFKFFNIHSLRLQAAGYFLYETVADKVDYSEFFEEFCLPDTFYSWFVVTELHLWMLMVRSMAEENGSVVRNNMVKALWSDVGMRIKKVGNVNLMEVNGNIRELSEQFQAAVLAYDEGLQSDDIILAGAIWRRIYAQGNVDPEYIDDLVKYVRRQTRLLESLSRDDLFVKKSVTWQTLPHKTT